MKQVVKWTEEGAVKYAKEHRVFCDVWHTSVAGDMKVSHKEYGSYRKARWHRE